MVIFSHVIQGASFDLDKEDRWEWKEGEKLGYTIKSTYLRLRGTKMERKRRCLKSFG